MAAVHVNAYFGDVSGNGSIDGLDVATALIVARGTATGFNSFTWLDRAIVGDVANDISVDAGDVSDLAAYTVRLPVPVIPAIPTGLIITPVGADPTLSLGQAERQGGMGTGRQGDSSITPGLLVSLSPGHIISVPVLLDDPHPYGSTGMTEAILALSYDPAMLTVSPADISLGSIPGAAAGWQIHSVVDQKAGRIGIELYNTTPLAANQGGSLVNVAFHVRPGEPEGVSPRSVSPWSGATTVQLLSSVIINGQQFVTQVDDDQGQYVLSPGIDRVVVDTAYHPGAIAAQNERPTVIPPVDNQPADRFLAERTENAAGPSFNGFFPTISEETLGTPFFLVAETSEVPAATSSGALTSATRALQVLFSTTTWTAAQLGRTDFQSVLDISTEVFAALVQKRASGAKATQELTHPQADSLCDAVVDKVFAQLASAADDFSDFGE